jgi:NADP-dependent 3-hydroxy acid dehydrogenase YdfG
LRGDGIAVTGLYPGAMNTSIFEKAGNRKDTTKALDPRLTADSIVYVCSLPEHVEIPELGIQDMRYS